jgi:hypothetical protein
MNSQDKTLNRRRARGFLSLVLAGSLLSLPGQAAKLEAGGVVVKTPPASAQAIAPLRDAIYAFDDAVAAAKGKVPADATERADKIQGLAGRAKGEIRAFTSRLKAAGETEAFDAYIEARAREDGNPTLSAELRGAGGGFAVLSGADSVIDEMVAQRRRAADQASVALLFEFLGIEDAHAAAGCAFFWWVISAGYGERFAYRSCYY